MARARARGSRRRAAVVAGAVAAVAVGGGVAWAATRSSGPVYRLADVERADVSQTVTGVGSMSSVTQRMLSFNANGAVRSVDVSVGSTVTAGQVVARLDATALEQQVRADESAVADARQKLATDESAQSSSSDSTDSLAATPLTAVPSSGGNGGNGAGNIASDQKAVVAAQAKLDALLQGPPTPQHPNVLAADITAMQTACASSAVTMTTTSSDAGIITGSVNGGSGLPVSLVGGTYADGSPVPSATVATDGSYTFGSVTQPLRADASYTVQLGDASNGVVGTGLCAAALTTVQHDELAVQQAERDLAAAERRLEADLAAAANGSSSRMPTGSRSSSSSSSSSGGGGSSRNTPNGSSTTITAAQLAADQKQIDAANAELAVAKQSLAAATLRSPIDGTVGAVSMSAGSSASSSSTITVIGHGRKAVTVSVGIGAIDSVKVGESATVTIDGVSRALPGKVTEVGVLNTSGTSGSTSTYPVTVLLDETSLPIYDGAGATVAIDVGTARNVLSVPISAVQRGIRGATVETYVGGKVVTKSVTLGVVGLDRVEIKSGLRAGDRVVLAEVSAPVPTSGSDQNRLGRFGRAVTFGTGGGARRLVGGN